MKTLQEKVHTYLGYTPGNIVWNDGYFLRSLFEEYGKEVVEKEIKIQKEKGGYDTYPTDF